MVTAIAAVAAVFSTLPTITPQANAATDAFYEYAGDTPLSEIAPGTVLATRTLDYRAFGAGSAVQLLYRSTDAQHRPSANVTSVLIPAGGVDPTKAVSYQSAYDSLNPEHGPSRVVAGQTSFGGLVFASESSMLTSFLVRGYTVIAADTEGQRADFAAGPEYGMNTLDSIRAATHSPATGLNADSRIGLFGYSGGAIATNWAAALAPEYAPDVDARLVGAAEGGVLVNPARNLGYISGSSGWSGVMVMAIIGVARSYDIDFTPYLNSYGIQLFANLEHETIANVLFRYPGLTWQQIAEPEYADPDTVAPFAESLSKINLGTAPTPTVPMFIGQGADGTVEGTDNGKPGIGAGDGVMVAADVRSLARQYCATGNGAIEYQQYDGLSHVQAMAPWLPAALTWLDDRFAGLPAPANCDTIAPGNPLTPQI